VPDNGGKFFYKIFVITQVVIPAKAGIQLFLQPNPDKPEPKAFYREGAKVAKKILQLLY
jgi:hypothetical protein